MSILRVEEKISYVVYLAKDEVPKYEKAGWSCKPKLRDTHHGRYSEYIGEWKGENPVMPD